MAAAGGSAPGREPGGRHAGAAGHAVQAEFSGEADPTPRGGRVPAWAATSGHPDLSSPPPLPAMCVGGNMAKVADLLFKV